jgi:TP901 family phage tail tape measure protein
MSQADIGINVFLLDSFTSPMGLVSAAMGLFADGLSSAIGLVGGATEAFAGFAVAVGGVDLLAFTSGIEAADQAASDLTNTMNQVAIAGDLTNGQLSDMQGYLMQVANTSRYSADQVGQGFSLLEEKGYSATQITQGLGQEVTYLAEAIGGSGSSGLVSETNLLASAMELYQAKASDAAHFSDLLTYAFYNGIPSVDGLRSALESVGGRANLLKVPFDQLVVVLDQLGRAGMTGSQAGASLNYFLTQLSTPLPKAQKELADLGILLVNKTSPAFEKLTSDLKKSGDAAAVTHYDGSVKGLNDLFTAAQKLGLISLDKNFYQWGVETGALSNKLFDAKGNFLGLVPAIQLLADKLKGLPPEQQFAALQALFSIKSGQAAPVLVQNLEKVLAKLDALKKSGDAHNLTMQDSNRLMDSQSNQAKALSTTFTDFLAQTGMPFQDAFKGILGGLNKLIGGLTTGSPQVHQFFTAFLTIGAVLSGVTLLVGTFMLLGGTLSFLLPALGILVGAIAGVAAVAGLLAGAWMWMQSHMAQVQHFIAPIIGMFQSLFKSLNFGGAIKQLSGAWNELVHAVQPFIPILKIIGEGLGILVGAAILGVIVVLVTLARIIIGVVTSAFHLLAGVLNVVSGVFYGFMDLVRGVFYTLTGNTQKANQYFSAFGRDVQRIIHGLIGVFGDFPHAVGNAFSAIGTFFHNFVQGAEQWGANLIHMFIQGLMHKMGDLKNMLGNIGQNIAHFLGFHSPTKEGPGSDADTWAPNLMHMLTLGIVAGSPSLSAAAMGAASGLRSAFTSPSVLSAQALHGSGSGNGLGSSTTTFNAVIDGRVVTSVVVDDISKQLKSSRVHGMIR